MELKEVRVIIAKLIKAPITRIYALTDLGNGYSYVYKDTKGFVSYKQIEALKEKKQ